MRTNSVEYCNASMYYLPNLTSLIWLLLWNKSNILRSTLVLNDWCRSYLFSALYTASYVTRKKASKTRPTVAKSNYWERRWLMAVGSPATHYVIHNGCCFCWLGINVLIGTCQCHFTAGHCIHRKLGSSGPLIFCYIFVVAERESITTLWLIWRRINYVF